MRWVTCRGTLLTLRCLERREDVYHASKKQRTQEKLKKRLEQVEQEKNDPAKKKVLSATLLVNCLLLMFVLQRNV